MTGCYPRQRRYVKGKEQGPYGQKSFLCPIILLAKLSLKNVRDPLKEAASQREKETFFFLFLLFKLQLR